MTTTVAAVYAQGVLRLLQPISLAEGTRVNACGHFVDHRCSASGSGWRGVLGPRLRQHSLWRKRRTRICVDTGAWFASVVPSDRDHVAAVRWLSQNTAPLITTDYVIDETLTLLKARGQALRALLLGEQFFRGALATMYYLTETDI